MGFLSHRAGKINRIIPINRAGFFEKLSASNDADEAVRRHNRFEWGIATFAAGIGLYFALPFEPPIAAIAAIIAIIAMLSFAMRRRALFLGMLLLALWFALGLGRAVWHTDAAYSPKLPEARSAYTVTGWIEAVERSGKGYRWRIRVTDIETYRDIDPPFRVRIRAKTEGFKVGDGVSVRALMTGPPGPVVPGGYDPARAAYFQRIGGYGFGISDPVSTDVSSGGFSRWLARFRYGLADRIMEKAPPDTAGLQAALLTGVRAYIPPEHTDALRTAGLAHVLAISGLHMGLLAGGAYGLSGLLLAMITPLSRRYDIRKFAAVAGLLSATGYLLLSGASVSTQRAYIMAVIVFLAVILDRRAFSMRSVAVAAAITLLLHPESLISAGFQMSFAAVAALVVVYRQWDNLGKRKYKGGIVNRTAAGLTTLSVTSIVAGAATGGFAILHFNRIATYGLAGNLIAMPVFTFIVMPAALGALILMPLGLEGLPLLVMGWGLDVVVKVSTWVASWDGALAYLSAAPFWIIGVYSLAFLWLCLGGARRRIAGVILMMLCVGVWARTPQPDMRISDSGQVAFWGDEQLYVGSKRADRYGREQFVQRAGKTGSEIVAYKDTAALCDALACRMTVKGRAVSVVSQPSEVPEECAASDIVILTQRRAGPVAKRRCQAVLIDEVMLRRGGAQDIYLKEDIRVKPAITEARRSRPWGRNY